MTRLVAQKLVAGLVALALAVPAAASPPTQPAGVPPQEVPAPLRSALAGEGTAVALPGGELTVWPVRRLPRRPAAAPSLGVAFPGLSPGELAGMLQLSRDWTDYRGSTIPPGLYALYYDVQPADGYHTGVSDYRDFLLLVPVGNAPGADEAPAGRALLDLARVARGTQHPAVLALFPVPAVEVPTVVDNDLGQPTLALPVDGVNLGLVLRGQGEGGS